MRKKLSSKKSGIPIKSPEEIEKIRKACKVTALILEELKDIIKPGITTEDINTYVHRRTLELGGTPAPLNYKGFPKSVCTSLNEVICHGIPSPEVVLKEGDIINVDVTTIVNGYFGDASRMYFVGGKDACSNEAVELVEITFQAMMEGIKAVKPGARFGDIGAAIERYIRSTGKGYGIVREYTGHGVGRAFHEPPQIPHFGKGGIGPVMEPGMTFTIEPMINLGTHKTVLSREDGWTVRTADGKLSAQWEETVAVIEDGVEILTRV
ncbi:MAG: type I methionyl aminopeptidase [Candidatus Dadabacteria bacterium]|nr:MAG: type I methionyl aminopeptidase [Candidatus Dadabacteria bacterium]